MDRVVERPASPTSTTNRSSTNSSESRHSRDSTKPRRSYYRLFPSVEPTPPASPVSLHHHNRHRASLRNSSAAGSYRRRSSSEDNGRGVRDSSLPPQVTTNLSIAPLKDVRKGSLPELPPLRTVQEHGRLDVASEVSQLGLKGNAEERGGSEARALANTNVVFDSALGQSTEVCESAATNAAIDSLVGNGHDGHVISRDAANAASSTTPAVVGLGLDLTADRRPHSQGQIYTRTKPRPNLRIAILEQHQDAKPAPPPKSARHLREDSTASSSNESMRSQSLQQDGPTPRESRVASIALKQSIVPVSAVLKVREFNVAPQPLRFRQLSPVIGSVEQLVPIDIEVSTVDDSSGTIAPQVPPKPSVGRWAELPSLHSRFSNRAATPEPYTRTATPEQHASYAIRPATSQGPTRKSGDHFDVPRSVTPSSVKSALATARANVAALSNVEVPTWNASFYEQTKSPNSDLVPLSAAPSHSGHGHIANPVKTLADLAEQCEVLHARQATLRAQRQKLSSGIIASLKDSRPGSDYGDMILHEQLALAAVSSSIDICFAKLKSIECQREDAIAALISQASAASRLSSELARMSRKSSLAPSMDLESRLNTGRSTPDPSMMYRQNRPGSIKTYSYRGEAESQRARSPLPRTASLSRKAHGNTEPEQNDRPSSRPKQHGSPITPGSSIENGGTPSTADEAGDDTQPSDLSDNESILSLLEDEDLRKHPHKKDANGNSVKAVKVLGIGIEDMPPVSPGLPSPLSLFSRKKAKTPPKLKTQLDGKEKAEVDKVSPLTSSTLNAEDNTAASPAQHDLELQLQRFPSAPAGSSTSRPVTAGLTIPPSLPPMNFTFGESTTMLVFPLSPGEEERAKTLISKTSSGKREDDVSPVVQRSDTTKSAHTINVYYDFGGTGREVEIPMPFP